MKKIYSFLLLVMIANQSYANNIIVGNLGSKIRGEVISTFSYPWSFSFLNNDHILVSTKPGKIWLLDSEGSKKEVKNIVSVEYAGQGGMGDIVPHPDFEKNYYDFKYLIDKVKLRASTSIEIKHNDIADDLHTSRVVISRILKQLENEKKIKLSRNKIEVLQF